MNSVHESETYIPNLTSPLRIVPSSNSLEIEVSIGIAIVVYWKEYLWLLIVLYKVFYKSFVSK